MANNNNMLKIQSRNALINIISQIEIGGNSNTSNFVTSKIHIIGHNKIKVQRPEFLSENLIIFLTSESQE